MIQMKLPFKNMKAIALARLFHYQFGYWTSVEQGMAWALGEIKSPIGRAYVLYLNSELTRYSFSNNNQNCFKIFIDDTKFVGIGNDFRSGLVCERRREEYDPKEILPYVERGV